MDLKSMREVSGLSQFSTALRSGVPRMRLGFAESGQIPLGTEEESALREVLLKAIKERQAQLQSVLDSTILFQCVTAKTPGADSWRSLNSPAPLHGGG
jgi:hypothetical protein